LKVKIRINMDNLNDLYSQWLALQPLSERKKYQLNQRFIVEYNYNSNHIEGNTLTYGQTEILLLFGKVITYSLGIIGR